MMNMKMKTNFKYLLFILVLLITFAYFYYLNTKDGAELNQLSNIPSFTMESISQFNGEDDSKPIYIAFDGYVYDVTPGRNEFYGPGKSYNYLTGKDSTAELSIAGGTIIKNKYKIVGRFVR